MKPLNASFQIFRSDEISAIMIGINCWAERSEAEG